MLAVAEVVTELTTVQITVAHLPQRCFTTDMARATRNKDRRVAPVTSADTRAVRRAERAEVTGARVGKMAVRATRNGWWYA